MLTNIRESFAKYFGDGISLPETLPARGEINHGSWAIVYVVGEDDTGKPSLEFIANNRFTNARRVLILSDGTIEPLPMLEEDFSFNPDIPGDREAAEARMNASNAAVTEELRRKGLIQ